MIVHMGATQTVRLPNGMELMPVRVDLVLHMISMTAELHEPGSAPRFVMVVLSADDPVWRLNYNLSHSSVLSEEDSKAITEFIHQSLDRLL